MKAGWTMEGRKHIGDFMTLLLAHWVGWPHYETKKCHKKVQRKLCSSERGITEQNYRGAIWMML